MATTQASVETRESPAGVADQTLIRASTPVHDASGAYGTVLTLALPWATKADRAQ